ncbi:Na+/H+ antiporter NhaA [Pseudokineococcus basanitobsidens]|uniref:Na(+)/H(+) antiporter NhaA n=1 Tax=Pseudokineococcus basanitobsidens TaxID=1926649 RepID=A0ABU8RPJ2_9ACTN
MSAQAPTGADAIRGALAPLGTALRTEVGSAALLLAATVAAVVWANLPGGGGYATFWDTEVGVNAGTNELVLSLRHWINDGLMTFFFFVIGLETKRELILGELADRRRAAVPALAALAGLALPAVVFALINHDSGAAGAWGVVISTDTAFLLGVLALLGRSVPAPLRVFLLALAIADDVGALIVIAIFYTDELRLGPLAVTVAVFALMQVMQRLGFWRGPAYLVPAVVAWVALYLSGVHPTLLGVAIALSIPAYRPRRDDVHDVERATRAYLQSPSPDYAVAARLSLDRSVPVGERLQTLWRPWTNLAVVPLFALANAGVPLSGEVLRTAATSPVTLGVIAGLVGGKLVGILLGTGLAVRLGLGDLAPGLRAGHLAGGAAMSGIGFTISLFIVDLAFTDDAQADQARVGILAASVLAAVLGLVLLRLAARGDSGERRPALLDPPVDASRDHVRGPAEAPLTLVEYADFECPFCGRATGSVEELRERFGDRLRYVFRHAPLDPTHVHAGLAAEAAEAADAQGRFWPMHDRLFTHQAALTSSDLLEHAAAVGLDVPRFARDLASSRRARRIQHDLESAQASGVPGTPAFYIGGRLHVGPTDAATLAAALLADVGEPADEL